MNWLYIPLVVLAGLSNPVQSAADSQVQKALGNVFLASLLIYGVALCGLLVVSPLPGWNNTTIDWRLGPFGPGGSRAEPSPCLLQ